MLKIIKSFSELNMTQYLNLCRDSIRKNGCEIYRRCSEEQQVQYAQEDLLDYLRDDFFKQQGAFCAVWVIDCVYKSALRIEPYSDGVLLHALETVPDARKMGYAYSLITAVFAYLRQENCTAVYSHVHKQNLPSLRLHEKCGFRKVADSAVYIDGTVTQNSCTMMLTL